MDAWLCRPRVSGTRTLIRMYAVQKVLLFAAFALLRTVLGCGYPGAPAHSVVTFTTDAIGPGTVATYDCESGFELLGPARRICGDNGTWSPPGIPFCVLNVATGKAPMQSTTAQGGVPQKAVDGSTSSFFAPDTCTLTEAERAPWWYVNLLEPYMVKLVRIDFGKPCCNNAKTATIVVRVGNNRPDLGVNPMCGKYVGFLEEGTPLFVPCSPPMPGVFVSIHLEGSSGNALSICEAFVYTDQALPIENCPSFRDQPLGSTATYNGRCYIFYNNQPLNFEGAQRMCAARGGSLVDETSPALQGFLSWELWRRHRNDPRGQYWMGAVRDPRDPNNWRWINGQDVAVSFWNLPGGNNNCSRFDGTKGWLWADTDCSLNLFFICHHRPVRCGIPERPPNTTILTTSDFTADTTVEYRCAPGHILVGPVTRTCLTNGFYTESTPSCRYLECGPPSSIKFGTYTLLNGTHYYRSVVSYSCDPGFAVAGRADLMCDVDERWDGPPPRCESTTCTAPPPILHGSYLVTTNSTTRRSSTEYSCDRPGFRLVGRPTLECGADGKWIGTAPSCVDSVRDPEAPSIPPRPYPIPPRPPTRQGFEPKEPRPSQQRPHAASDDLFASVAADDGHSIPTFDRNGGAEQGREDPRSNTRLNLSGIIALSVFGGFVVLAAIITGVVIVCRRSRRSRASSDNTTVSTDDSMSTEGRGMNKYYKRAWENLRGDSKAGSNGALHRLGDPLDKHAQVSRQETLDAPNYRTSGTGTIEGLRDTNEMLVSDATAWNTRTDRKDKKRHHHHHHHHHHNHHRHRHGSPDSLDDGGTKAWSERR